MILGDQRSGGLPYLLHPLPTWFQEASFLGQDHDDRRAVGWRGRGAESPPQLITEVSVANGSQTWVLQGYGVLRPPLTTGL